MSTGVITTLMICYLSLYRISILVTQTSKKITHLIISIMATELTKQYHLNTIKDTLDYLHATRLKNPSEMLDSMIHDLTEVIRLIKGLKEDAS